MWIRCFAHVLNICVQKMLKVTSGLVQKVKPENFSEILLLYLYLSLKASRSCNLGALAQRIEKFKKMLKTLRLQNEDSEEEEMWSTEETVITQYLLPILDGETRWSSGYFFDKRGLKLRVAIDEIAKNKDLRKYELSKEDWRILHQVLEFLEEFAIITKYIEGSGYPTLSLVVPMYHRLLVILEDISKNLHESISHPLIVEGASASLQKLSLYYDKTSPIVIAATFMDPRLKMQYFIDNGWQCGGNRGMHLNPQMRISSHAGLGQRKSNFTIVVLKLISLQ